MYVNVIAVRSCVVLYKYIKGKFERLRYVKSAHSTHSNIVYIEPMFTLYMYSVYINKTH